MAATFRAAKPRLVILDLMLPGLDGLTVCRELRKTFSGPILMLTAKNTDMDEVVGLTSGADDYVAKPADPMVLLARIHALLRRAESRAAESVAQELVCGALRLRRTSRQVWLGERPVALSTKEFALLALLMDEAGTVLSRDDLYQRTRGIEYDGLDRSIDVLVSRLRRKLGDTPTQPEKIKTVWGQGYLLVPDAWDDPG